ncbi:MAG TPA: O-antigen ligase family protein [Gemmatimonadales bacterium]
MAVSGNVAVLPAREYWRYGLLVAIGVLLIIAVRVHELVPQLAPIRPAIIFGYGGTALLLMNSSDRVIADAIRNPVMRLVALYFTWAAVTAPLALWVGLAADTVKGLMAAMLPVVALMLVRPGREQLHRLQVVLVSATFLIALKLLVSWSGGRLSQGASFDSNDVASLMAIMLPLALGLAIRARGWHRVLGAVAAFAFIFTAIRTGSRGGTLAVAAAAVVYVLGFPGHRRIIAVVLFMVGSLVTWQLAPAGFRERMISLRTIEQDYNYTSYGGRKQIWQRAREYIRENPVMGVGAGNFPIREGNECTARGMRCKWSATHNAYLQAGAELGLVGLALYIGMLLAAAKQVYPFWRRRKGAPPEEPHQPELLACLLGFAAGAYFLSHAYFYPMFGVLGLCAYAGRVRVTEMATGRAGAAAVIVHQLRSGWRTTLSRRPGRTRAFGRSVAR